MESSKSTNIAVCQERGFDVTQFVYIKVSVSVKESLLQQDKFIDVFVVMPRCVC